MLRCPCRMRSTCTLFAVRSAVVEYDIGFHDCDPRLGPKCGRGAPMPGNCATRFTDFPQSLRVVGGNAVPRYARQIVDDLAEISLCCNREPKLDHQCSTQFCEALVDFGVELFERDALAASYLFARLVQIGLGPGEIAEVGLVLGHNNLVDGPAHSLLDGGEFAGGDGSSSRLCCSGVSVIVIPNTTKPEGFRPDGGCHEPAQWNTLGYSWMLRMHAAFHSVFVMCVPRGPRSPCNRRASCRPHRGVLGAVSLGLPVELAGRQRELG